MTNNNELTLDKSERLLKSFEQIEDRFSSIKIAENDFYLVQKKSGFLKGLLLADIDIENGTFFISHSSDIKPKPATSFSVSNDSSELENIKNNSILKSLKKEERGEYFSKNQLTVNFNTYNLINKKVVNKMLEINDDLKNLLKSYNSLVFQEVKKTDFNIDEIEQLEFLSHEIKDKVQKYGVLNNILSESPKLFFNVIEYNENKNPKILNKLTSYYSSKNLFDEKNIGANNKEIEANFNSTNDLLGNKPLQNYFNKINDYIENNDNQLENLNKLIASTKLLTANGLYHEFSFDDNKEDVLDFIDNNSQNKLLSDNKNLIMNYLSFKTQALDVDCIKCQALSPLLVNITNTLLEKESYKFENNLSLQKDINSELENKISDNNESVESNNNIKEYLKRSEENLLKESKSLLQQVELDFGDIGENTRKKKPIHKKNKTKDLQIGD